MKRRIYLLEEEGELRELVEESFVSEDRLQTLLAEHPDLLGGDQMNEESPRRWLLIDREADVPDREDGSGRWALDHLFLDQDGVPTLVEVKRSTDTRIRREVVGQMLDYAANGMAYWPLEKLRALFEARCDQQGLDPGARLEEFLDESEADPEEFWQRVKTNLKAGRIRLVFVADEIPPELRRVVEFLNGQMDPAEVLAVAVRQYAGGGLRTLVPNVLGQTAEAQSRKGGGPRPSRQWDEESFFAELEATRDEAAVRAARRAYQWAQRKMPEIWWGRGARMGSLYPGKTIGGVRHSPFGLWTYGLVELQFQHMERPFDDLELRRELMERLNRIPGVSLPEEKLSKRPSFAVSVLDQETAWTQFLEAMEWYLAELDASHPDRPKDNKEPTP